MRDKITSNDVAYVLSMAGNPVFVFTRKHDVAANVLSPVVWNRIYGYYAATAQSIRGAVHSSAREKARGFNA